MPTTTGVATTFMDFTRASNATVTDSDGKVKWAPSNLLLASESFDAASWTKGSGVVGPPVVTANNVVAPNGTQTADRIAIPAVSGTNASSSLYQTPTQAFSTPHTAGVYLRGDVGGEVVWIGYTPNAVTYTSMQCTLTTSWQLFTVNYTTSASGTQYFLFGVDLRDASQSAKGAQTIYAWGASLYRSDLGGMQPNTSAYPMYNPTTPKNLLGYTESLTTGWTGTNGVLQGNGAELVTNGDFSSGTGWTLSGAGVSITGGQLVFNAAGATEYATQAVLTVGKSFFVTYTVSGYSAGVVRIAAGGTSGTNRTANGTYTEHIQSTTNTQLYVISASGGPNTYNIDNISAQEVAAYEAPNGLQTARAVDATSANGTLLGSLSLLASPYTFSVWLKRKTGSGTVEITVDGTTYVAAAVTGTWTRFSTTLTPTAGTKTPGIRLVISGDAVYAWGAQLSDSASLDTYAPVYGAAVTSAAYYGPRRDFDGATLACKGLLVEEQRSNLVLRSAEFDNAAWTPFSLNTTGTPQWVNAATAPDGTMTAEKLIPNTTSTNVHAIASTATIAVANSTAHTWSVYAKADGYDWIAVVAYTNSISYLTWFNVSTGATGTNAAGNTAHPPVAVGNGWYKLSVTRTTASTVAQFILYAANADNQPTFAGNGTSGVLVWGAQLEVGASSSAAHFATSYIPTGSASATRNADVASVSTQAFPYSATEGTLVANATIGNTSTQGPVAVTLNDGSGNNIIYTLQIVGTGIRRSGIIYTGAVEQALLSEALTNTVGLTTKAAFAFKVNDVAGSINGGTVLTDTSATIPPVNTMRIGDNAGGSQTFNGWIRQITYLPRRISNAELQTRTTL